MVDPNSWLTRWRRWLARAIEPTPMPGEGWCLNCTFNDYRTLIISADGVEEHVTRHTEAATGRRYTVQVAWPPQAEPPQEY